MKIYDNFDSYSICCVCGDIHGEFDVLLGRLKRLRITDALIIVAGDCGIGFDVPSFHEQLYKRLEKTLEKLNCCLLLVRGSHDDPAYFEKEFLSFPRMKTVPDYSVLRFRQRTILCVGGAISIDRRFRLSRMRFDQEKEKNVRKLYWEQEAPCRGTACRYGDHTHTRRRRFAPRPIKTGLKTGCRRIPILPGT